MKTTLLTIALFLASSPSFSQKTTQTLLETKINHLDCIFQKITDGDQVFHMVFISYQNMEYQHIVDIGAIVVTDSLQLQTLITQLDSAISKIQNHSSNQGSTFEWEGTRYKLVKYGSATIGKHLYIYNDRDKHTYINAKQAAKLRDWLKTVQFPS